jgi:hypothetical protein
MLPRQLDPPALHSLMTAPRIAAPVEDGAVELAMVEQGLAQVAGAEIHPAKIGLDEDGPRQGELGEHPAGQRLALDRRAEPGFQDHPRLRADVVGLIVHAARGGSRRG